MSDYGGHHIIYGPLSLFYTLYQPERRIKLICYIFGKFFVVLGFSGKRIIIRAHHDMRNTALVTYDDVIPCHFFHKNIGNDILDVFTSGKASPRLWLQRPYKVADHLHLTDRNTYGLSDLIEFIVP